MKHLAYERNTMPITSRSSVFILIATMLVVAAMLGSCDKFEITLNTNASTESFSGTQTWAAYGLETLIPTEPPATNTPSPPPKGSLAQGENRPLQHRFRHLEANNGLNL
jgi:hypothetical protein